jgi:hypothetical protein
VAFTVVVQHVEGHLAFDAPPMVTAAVQ